MKLLLVLSFSVLIACACGPNQRILESAEENRNTQTADSNSTIAPAESSFEKDLMAMRNANFSFIYVFRRRDGAAFDGDDKSFITATTPMQMNRRSLSDGGKALIIGSNFRLPAENLAELTQRFLFEDYSPAGRQ